ncbi:YtxH domain-containing protein [Streptomyces sp. 3MP-14]|uniref:YtxH domain-containing protein n=1 Tax=Streptomyces mimosae TaxID=2586635 RepID=A0A5N6ASI8_9ACTN|nr:MULTISPECIES: YtxH domain-containing protein [Streptomyces]KAB8170880.1 YtxH domain-containing protein [Streptomyces mimosae]KAB8179769.1 YtxH domain-containing protein [Streptomyces sp. 3MP-14]
MRKLVFIAGVAVGYVLGARAGRERYEQLAAAAERLRTNPAVRNSVDSAAHAGRQAAAKAAEVVADRAGDRLPEGVAGRLRAVSGGREAADASLADDWGTR